MKKIMETVIPVTKKINLQLLPIRFHYILFWGGTACSMQYLSLLAKDIGLSGSAIGMVFSISSLCLIIAQPGFGAICDRFKNEKYVMMFIIITSGILLFSVPYIPSIPSINEIKFNCSDRSYVNRQLCSLNNSFESMPKIGGIQQILRQNSKTIDVFCTNNQTEKEYYQSLSDTNSEICSMFLNFQTNYTDHVLDLISCNSSMTSCLMLIGEEQDPFRIYYLWALALIMVFSHVFIFSGYVLSDSICQKILGKENELLFGNQKFWSSCAYGISSLVAGYLNDILYIKKYEIGFYMMLGAFLLDIYVMYNMPNGDNDIAKFCFKHLSQIFTSFEIIVFLFGVFLIGNLTVLAWNYQYIFLRALGASKTNLGVVTVCQYVFANCIFYVLSGRIIRKVGHIYCLVLSFIAFSLRYLLWFFLKNTWYAIGIELLEGVTFALTLVNMVTFAREKAPVGTRFTMLGVFSAVFQGIGISCGSLFVGFGFDHLGMRNTVLVASGLSIFCSATFFLIGLLMKCKITAYTCPK